jgi:hypothetical protein
VIQANCRARFTADDFSFVVRVLSKSQRDAVSLVSLLSDEAERDTISSIIRSSIKPAA